MKSPDITLFLQAIHFFIAYYMLRTYIFYPAMQILNKEEAQDKKLHDAIEKASEQKNNAEEQKRNRWVNIKETLHSLIPKLSILLSGVSKKSDTLDSFSDKQDSISKEQRDAIKKTVSDSLSDIKI